MRKYAGLIRNTSSGQAIGFSFTIARNNPHCGIGVRLGARKERPFLNITLVSNSYSPA
jgi:hypothetical protein